MIDEDLIIKDCGYYKYCIPYEMSDKFYNMLSVREKDLWIDFNATFEDYRISLSLEEYE